MDWKRESGQLVMASTEPSNLKPRPKAAALYARVSTKDQTCGLQLDELRRYASQRFDQVLEFVDVGISGTERRRPQLDLLMQGARKRLFDVVAVRRFDRFARSLKHLLDSLQEFHSLGIDFVSLTEAIDTTTPTGQLLFGIFGAVAQFERDLIAERVRAGIAHARSLGKQIGRPRVKVDAGPIIRLRSEDLSLRQIARKLDIPVSRVRRALMRNTNSGNPADLMNQNGKR
jgi:DNA invertase Pin-like site-specific DNA recombinase